MYNNNISLSDSELVSQYGIIKSYYDNRDIMHDIVVLMGYKCFRACNKHLNDLSKKHDINQDWFNDIVRIWYKPSDKQERLTRNELQVYYNYCIINKIVLPH